jgi:BirA family biotin operon repressor/biotin-[acetyl-CoA-carboxylase] ligase
VADSLAPDQIRPLLRGRFGREYRFEQRCPSTQRLLEPGDAEGTVAVAEEQTEGRGRLGRAWQTPAGTGVLVSVLLRPAVPLPALPGLTLVAGRAVADAIREVAGLEPAIKLPNDVLLSGRKVAGILAESSEGRVVLGIGVNANQSTAQLPANVRTEATSLAIELGRPVGRAELLAAVLAHLERAYDRWVSDNAASG